MNPLSIPHDSPGAFLFLPLHSTAFVNDGAGSGNFRSNSATCPSGQWQAPCTDIPAAAVYACRCRCPCLPLPLSEP